MIYHDYAGTYMTIGLAPNLTLGHVCLFFSSNETTELGITNKAGQVEDYVACYGHTNIKSIT